MIKPVTSLTITTKLSNYGFNLVIAKLPNYLDERMEWIELMAVAVALINPIYCN